jgi:hypothetical protein
MFKHHTLSRAVWPGLAILGVLTLSAQPVSAGECPADKIKPNAQQMVDYKPVGVTDVTLGAIDLGKQPAHIEGRELRFRTGAGIVIDSDPQRELDETRAKAKGMLRALGSE